MSATRNEESTEGFAGQGEFSSKVPADEPMLSSGHQPGKKVSPADHAPEFTAEVLPAGSAPLDRTFSPNSNGEAPPTAQYDSRADADGKTTASETIGGATSADVHTGLGHPGQGQSSSEMRHDGEQHRKKQGLGLAGQASTMESETADK